MFTIFWYENWVSFFIFDVTGESHMANLESDDYFKYYNSKIFGLGKIEIELSNEVRRA